MRVGVCKGEKSVRKSVRTMVWDGECERVRGCERDNLTRGARNRYGLGRGWRLEGG